MPRFYPFIEYSTGGSIDGMIRAIEANLAKVMDKMIVIPGRGAIGDKSQLTLCRELLVTVRDKVAALKSKGRLSMKIVAAKPTAPWGCQVGRRLHEPAYVLRTDFRGV